MKKKLFLFVWARLSILSLLVLLFCGFTSTIYAKKYDVDTTHSSVGFMVKHLLVSDVDGVFTDYVANFEMEKSEIRKFDLDISVESVDTRNQRRDDDLRSDKFFDAGKHAKITFRGTGYRASNPNKGKLAGELSIKNISQKVVLDVVISDPIQFRGKEVYGLNLTGKINRKDFKVGENFPSAVVSDEVTIKVSLEIKS